MCKTGDKVKIVKGKNKGKKGVVANATGDFVDIKVPGEKILVSTNRDEVEVMEYVALTFKQFLEGEVVPFKHPSKEVLKYIQNWHPTGDSLKDGEMMDTIHNFIMNKKNPKADRRAVLAKLDQILKRQWGQMVHAENLQMTILKNI